VSWDLSNNAYYNDYSDPDTHIQYYADDMWYYTSYYNVLTGETDSYYADYYNVYSDDDGYYSEIYASPDWSEYYGTSSWDTDAGYSSYYFNSNTNTEENYYETKDGLYNSYYDSITDNFSEYVYTAPVDQYYSF